VASHNPSLNYTSLQRLFCRFSLRHQIPSFNHPLGDKDQAFAELDRAYDEHDWQLQRINPLRDDPRYKDLLKRMNLPV